MIFLPQRTLASTRSRDSNRNSPRQICFKAAASSVEETAVRKPNPPMLMPRMGVAESLTSRATRSIVPSPPNTSSKSTSRLSAAMSGQTAALMPASCAVAGSLKTFRPAARISRAAFCTVRAKETFSEFPTSPMRLILSASFFNQCQKFFVACRAEQRRFRDAAPAQPCLLRHKFFQLAQHALMHRRIGDDARALVRLGLACLELRFDQRDDFTDRTQQRNGGRNNFAERNERAIYRDEINRRFNGSIFDFNSSRLPLLLWRRGPG